MRILGQDFRNRTTKLLLGAVLVVCLPLQTAWAAMEKRVALVIGNSSYRSAIPLENPVTDAKAVAAALKRIGFDVVEGYDLGTSEMRTVLAQFSSALPDAKAAMVYYAGHGVSVDEENFLIPTDLSLKSQTDLDLNAISLSLVLKQMKREERVNVVILDACRDNPFAADLMRGSRSRSAVAERGLSRVETDLAKGTLIAFATDPKSTALDGKAGDNSPFTKALLRHMEVPGISIDAVMSRVRADVWEETKQRQMPWVNTSIIGEFILNPVEPGPKVASLTPGTETVTTSSGSERLAQENKMWDSAERGNSAEDYKAYLDAYPNGIYAGMARARVNRLTPVVASAPPSPAAPVAAPTPAPALQASVESGVVNGGVAAAAVAALAGRVEATRGGPSAEALKGEATSQQGEKLMKLGLQSRKEVQQRLIALGYDAGEPNGTFSQKTRDALGAWQAKNELPQTKYLGPLQRKALLEQSEEAWKRVSMLRPAPVAPPPATRKIAPQRQQAAPAPRVVREPVQQARKPTRQVRQPREVDDDVVSVRQQQRAPQQVRQGYDGGGVGAFIGGVAVGGALRGLLRR